MNPEIGRVDWLDGVCDSAPACPACNSDSAKDFVLETLSLNPEQRVIQLVRCGDCGTHYWTDLTVFNYETFKHHRWSTTFYVEQGAGLDDLIEPLVGLSALGMTRGLEIGCGFGFSVDAGSKLFGWTMVGVDPSPLAQNGRAALGMDIRHIYADVDTDLGGAFDFVYASEVIEHVADPWGFLRICRAHLRQNGVLVLTTPDADFIRPDISTATLFPILTPGHHLVLFSANSLKKIVEAVGFNHVQVSRKGHSVVLYASDKPLEIDPRTVLDRPLYRSYLIDTLEKPNLRADLRMGVRYRLFKDLVNSGEYDAALSQYAQIVEDCKGRFGVEPNFTVIDKLLSIIEVDRNSEVVHIPFCLAGILFFRGLIAINQSPITTEVVQWFDAAAAVARSFRALYQYFGMDDGETGMIEGSAAELSIIALCHVGPEEAVARMQSMADPGEDFIKKVVFRLVDLGIMGPAKDTARLSSAPALTGLATGWEAMLVGGKDAEAHVAFATAAAAGGDIALRAWSGDMLVLSSFDPDSAVALGRELRTAASIDLSPLFMRLVDHGHMVHAAAIAPLVTQENGWRLNFSRGMMSMLHARQPANAAVWFRKAFDQAQHEPDSERWVIKHRELLADISAGDMSAAGGVVDEIARAGDRVPEHILESVRQLLHAHPAIQRSRR